MKIFQRTSYKDRILSDTSIAKADSRVLRRVFGPKKDEVIGSWKKTG
jgi:hypothetical protein